MKKILLATTMLIGTAGFAAAEGVTLSGSAAAGVARDADGVFGVYNSGTIDIAASTETDGGLSISMSTDVSFGRSYGFADDDGFAPESGAIGAPTLSIAGAFGTLTLANDGIDHLYDGDNSGDVSYAYTAGDLSFGVVYDIDDTDQNEDVAGAQLNVWSANVAYTVSGVGLSLTVDDRDSYNAAASYTTGGLTATVETDSDAGADAVNTLTLAYAVDAISGEVSVDDADGWSVALGYSANGVGLNVSTDDASAWEATASYDLGGGASLEAGVNYTDDAYAGVSFSF